MTSLAVSATYSFNPLAGERDEIRFLVTDNAPDDFQLADAEIDAAIQFAQTSVGNPAGTLSVSALAVVGTTAAGATSITLDGPAVVGTVMPGATFSVAGSGQRYTVTDPIQASNNTLSALAFWPGLVTQAADNAVVTFRVVDIGTAAAICCEVIAGRFARKADVTIDGRSESYRATAQWFTDRARNLRRQTPATGGAFGVKLVRV